MSNGITTKLRIGVLEVQGAFQEHKNALNKAAKELNDRYILVEVTEVRHSDHITDELNGLIIPGGESTAISLFLKRNNMEEPLRTWIRDKNHITWGTCAGMILLAKETEHQKQGGQISLNCMDTVVSRNYFGRQINSFEADFRITDPDLISKTNAETDYFHGVFIRAPAILRTTCSDVEVLATLEENSESSVIVAARQGNILCTSFHPELTEDTRWHRYFLKMILNRVV
ncbi:hypothetical protein LOTGIDRAFT_116826 [Lottia gigantea]|uniref:glutaminase n=1 Tax=Lottia gigantea TaxID=225164 RepID=V4C1U3_LOTGI|nr:hypothetical protein LOTGIDRAFT_116826 [Lottia gigantea]ESO95429.1 hypothetical protein LOTGIDRAFT_116826 [Lottia gigantea]